MRHLLVYMICICSVTYTYGQTKADLQMQIDRQKKSIDSLQAIVDNQANIIENRDRSIKILQEDVDKGLKEVETLNGKIRQKNTELVNLREQNKSGEAKRITLSNIKSILTVPAGKYWVVNQFIGDYMADLTKDSLGNPVGKEIHVFLKSINNVTLTDTSKNMLGPQVYSSVVSSHTIQFPLILTENTTFTIIVLKGKLDALEPYDGAVICTYYEKAN